MVSLCICCCIQFNGGLQSALELKVKENTFSSTFSIFTLECTIQVLVIISATVNVLKLFVPISFLPEKSHFMARIDPLLTRLQVQGSQGVLQGIHFPFDLVHRPSYSTVAPTMHCQKYVISITQKADWQKQLIVEFPWMGAKHLTIVSSTKKMHHYIPRVSTTDNTLSIHLLKRKTVSQHSK